ncbi:MAG: guanine deaminase [Lentisphaerae bacterium GWF2_45_14]|nr:MAG: guanine deaminase [Lentisphaerae bacterium GWF2_45_14]
MTEKTEKTDALRAFRGGIFHFTGSPTLETKDYAYEYFPDGILTIKNGLVESAGPADKLLNTLPTGTKVIEFKDSLIMPGFIDSHIHQPQLASIASYGEQLMSWLEDYIFPAEERFKDKKTAVGETDFILRQLLKSGTTTAAVFCSRHKVSAEALFEKAEKLNMRLIGGMVMMDGHRASDGAEKLAADTVDLIEKWHNRSRISYAVTPRFAPGCTETLLQLAGEIYAAHPGTYMQTHLGENKSEVKQVKELFPWAKSYLDVYDNAGLLGERSILAHALHLKNSDFERIGSSNSVIAHCPSSNFFLGSGIFKFKKVSEFKIRTAIGSDVGAGNWISLLPTLGEAYKMAQLQNYTLSPFKAFHMLTLGGAEALSLDKKIGNFVPGKEADFIVLDLKATELIEYRLSFAKTLLEKLFVLMMIGDERLVKKTFLMGRNCL